MNLKTCLVCQLKSGSIVVMSCLPESIDMNDLIPKARSHDAIDSYMDELECLPKGLFYVSGELILSKSELLV